MRLNTALGLVRPFTLLAPAVGALAHAWAASHATDVALPWKPVSLGVAAALAATGASNAWNQSFDAPIDRVNRPTRPIPAGHVSESAARRFGHLLAACSLVLAFLASTVFGLCVLVGVLATWISSAPPLRTKRRTLGALLTIAVPRGFLVPLAGWALVGDAWTRTDPLAWGVVSFLFVLGAAATKDFADVAGDEAPGCRTLPLVVGVRRAAWIVAPFLALPFVLLPLLGALGWIDAPASRVLTLACALAGLGLATAWQLVRDPESMGKTGRPHPAWIGMYLLLLALHVGAAWVHSAQ